MTDLLTLTADVAAGYLSNHKVAAEELPDLIRTIHQALEQAERGPPAEPQAPQLTPAQIRKSITPEALISFEDGKPYRMLRRHLVTKGITPEEYRSKWGLPNDYPMVAPAYSERRSALAKAAGLGRTIGREVAEGAQKVAEVVMEATADIMPGDAPAETSAQKPRRGRPRKVQT